MLINCLSYALLNCITKHLSISMHPVTMVFYRNAIGLILIIPFIYKNYSEIINFKSFGKLNLYRGIFGLLSMIFWFYAISGIAVTEVVSISFLTPIFASILAVIIFNEKSSINKVLALIIGFSGTYVVLQPSINGINIYVISALAACILWASATLIVKRLTKSQSPTLIVFYMAAFSTLTLLPWLFFNWYIPTLKELLLLTLIAMLSNIAQLTIAEAYTKAAITVLMPFDFTRLLFTALIAYIFFGELFEANKILGSAMIIFASYLAVIKEKKISR